MSTAAIPDHRWISVLIQTGGVLGTMKCTKDVAGGGSTRLSVSGSSWDCQFNDSPLEIINFPAGTYVTGDIYTWDPFGNLTHSGTGSPTPTIRSPDATTRGLGVSWNGQ